MVSPPDFGQVIRFDTFSLRGENTGDSSLEELIEVARADFNT